MGLEKRYLALSPGDLKPSVLNSVWERYDESSYQSLKWTLANFTAMLVVACLTSLIALAQTQCWSLLRYIIAQYTKSPRLPDDSTPDPLLELSQGHTVLSLRPVLFGWTSRLFDKIRTPFRAESPHTRDTQDSDDPVESPYFGLASILNISFFLVMGVAIPWWLTEGALGTPIVKSRNTEECLKSNSASHQVWRINRLSRADDIFHLCQDRLDAGCDSPYYLSDPQITKTRSTVCPFQGRICIGNTPSFEITQRKVSAFEMGVNSRSNLYVNRRLTCAPVSLNPFLSRPQNGSFIYVKKAFYNETVTLWPNISLTLSTKNGPDIFSKKDSGIRMVQEDGPHDLNVLPSEEMSGLNELMERNDGQSFLVVYRAGRRFFPTMINDPFFAAYRKAFFPFVARPQDGPFYYPNHEATALGCVEQFQYCLPQSHQSDYCTDWGTCNKAFSAIYDYLAAQFPGGFNGHASPAFEHWNGQIAWSLKEMLVLYKSVCSSFAVQRYLRDRTLFLQTVPLIKWGLSVEDYRWFEVDREPWVAEVETWFMKSFLSGILTIQDGSLFTVDDLDSSFSPEYIREWKLCGRVLLHDGDFTNINWIGLWVTSAVLTFICLVGNQVHTVHRCLKFLSKLVKVKSLSRRWSWHGRGRGSDLHENPENAEMDDLEESSTVPEGDEEIDNTI
ncbi:hypothetical protein V8E51_000081 [Hyaloscypha variabilis]